jgi:hypothetical protein
MTEQQAVDMLQQLGDMLMMQQLQSIILIFMCGLMLAGFLTILFFGGFK